MSSQDFPGSRWWRFDFHCHTPASTDWRGDPGMTPEAWLSAHRLAGADALAVTDHNSGAWVRALQGALDALKQQDPDAWADFGLFPGVELSCNGGVHLLAIFDPSRRDDVAIQLLGAVGYHGTLGDSTAVTRMSVEETARVIHRLGGLAIPAHVDRDKGLLVTIQDANTLRQMLSAADAVEVCDPAAGCLTKLSDFPHLARVRGADSHKPDEMGATFSWVKMSRPTLEGLRLALLDQESAFRRGDASPDCPEQRSESQLVSLSIEKLQFCQHDPVQVAFSPWFNAAIGGRGSGKSTLVECLRLVLRRVRELEPYQEVKAAFDRFNKPSQGRGKEGALTDGTVIRAVFQKGQGAAAEWFRLTWDVSAARTSVERLEANTWVEVPSGVTDTYIPRLFPVRLYSQKQVYELANRPRALLALIDEAIDKAAWQRTFDDTKNRYLGLRAQMRQLETGLANQAQVVGELRDIERKLRVFETSHHAELLRQYQAAHTRRTRLGEFQESLRGQVAALREAVAEENRFDGWTLEAFDPTVADEAELLALAERHRQGLIQEYHEVRVRVERMEAVLASLSRQAEASPWAQRASQALAGYETLLATLREQGIDGPQQYGLLVHKREGLRQQLAGLERTRTELTGLQEQAAAVLADMQALRQRLTEQRSEFVAGIRDRASNVRITLAPFADIEDAETTLRGVLRLADGRHEDSVLNRENQTGFLADLHRQEVSAERLAELKVSLANNDDLVLETTVNGKFNTALAKLKAEDFDQLACWFPEDSLKVDYRPNADAPFRSIDSASAGQKTSALLSFILAYGDEPLILDQPEDDLDNALISDLIVRQVREQKHHRQILVVTHNPNIVVNGDAELVISMEFHNGQIRVGDMGGLQERAVRETICRVMEGGRDAFERRYKKILKDLEAVA